MTQFTGVHTFQAQTVLLKRSSVLREMDVTSTHEKLTPDTSGSVRFNGKVIAVRFDAVQGIWIAK